MENENRAQECCMIKYCVWILCVKKVWKLCPMFDLCVFEVWVYDARFLMLFFEAWGYDARIVLMC